ncbi:MAG: flagellin, partial [Alphaproteobacteria bacterium]|nr:flagellin [Alphaproteobacteria bacterium]
HTLPDQSQQRVNTGLRVSTAADDPSSYAIANRMKGDRAGYESVQIALGLGDATVNTAIKAGEAISDLLIEVKAKCVQANQAGLDQDSRVALNNDFTSLLVQIDRIVASASFNGKNLIDAPSTSMTVLSTVEGSSITVSAVPLSAAALQYGVPNCDLLSSANAVIALSVTNSAIVLASSRLAALGSAAKSLRLQNEFVSKNIDILREGIGNIVDADLPKESATIQSLQIKQQLGTQALAIANSRPQSLLGLFGG